MCENITRVRLTMNFLHTLYPIKISLSTIVDEREVSLMRNVFVFMGVILITSIQANADYIYGIDNRVDIYELPNL